MYLNNLEPYWISGSCYEDKVTWDFVHFCMHDTDGQYLASSKGFTCFKRNFYSIYHDHTVYIYAYTLSCKNVQSQ